MIQEYIERYKSNLTLVNGFCYHYDFIIFQFDSELMAQSVRASTQDLRGVEYYRGVVLSSNLYLIIFPRSVYVILEQLTILI